MRFAFLSILFFSCTLGFTQGNWGSLVLPQDTFSYWVGPNNPNANWRLNNFNDNTWQKGVAGFGYGDGDDVTILPNAQSVFIRKSFQITSLDSIGDAIFHLDFDDGFVAFLNGVEISRENMASALPNANEFANNLREATMYQGGLPKEFFIGETTLKSILQNGKNTLAIQVHNYNATSSDLSCIPFFNIKLKSKGNPYHPTPSWFNPPKEFTKSHLPIVSINTNGQTIVDDPEIFADMKVWYSPLGDTNHINSSSFHYNGKIAIELRGESSLTFPKKSFKVETKDNLGNNLNFPLMGFPEENDWIFYGPYSDKSLIRNAVTFELYQSLEGYASKIQFFELVLNNSYEGIYLLMEKIKRDKNRVDIATLNPQDTIGEELTGGYIVRLDKIEPNGSPGFFSYPTPNFQNYGPNYFQFYDPKDEELNSIQKTYIQSYFQEAESALTNSNFFNPVTGYQKYIDIKSFIDYHIMNELTKNVDGYRFSTYFYKDKSDVIKAGPPWDFNLAYGNVDYWDEAYKTDGWIYPYPDRLWWTVRMLQDYSYLSQLHCRWKTLRLNEFSNENIETKIDSLVNYLGDATQRNFERWQILGNYVWPNKFIGNTHKEEINFVKNWMINRAEWMDMQWTIDCPQTSSIYYNQNIFEATVFPNPIEDAFTLNIDFSGSYELKISDVFGKIHHKENINLEKGANHLNPFNLASGIYFLQLKNEQGITKSIKIIKR